MFKIEVVQDNILLSQLQFDKPDLAIDKFKELVNTRLDRAFLNLLVNNTKKWSYDLRPESHDKRRWLAKETLLSGQNILPCFIGNHEMMERYKLKYEKLIYLRHGHPTRNQKAFFELGYNMFQCEPKRGYVYDCTDYDLWLKCKDVSRYL